MRVRFEISLPPSVNHLYTIRWQDGRRCKTNRAVQWQQNLGWTLLQAGIGREDWSRCLVGLGVVLHVRPRRIDEDGILKLLQDSLADYFSFDDKAVMRLRVDKDWQPRKLSAREWLTVELWRIDAPWPFPEPKRRSGR